MFERKAESDPHYSGIGDYINIKEVVAEYFGTEELQINKCSVSSRLGDDNLKQVYCLYVTTIIEYEYENMEKYFFFTQEQVDKSVTAHS